MPTCALILTALIASCVSSIVTLMVALLVLAPSTRAAPDPQTVQPVVRAERFELADRSGAVRAIIGGDVLPTRPDPTAGQVPVFGAHVGMVLQDTAGRPRFASIVDEDGTSTIAQLDANGRARNALFLYDVGLSGLNMQDARGYGGIALGIHTNTPPGMIITDSEARVRARLGVDRGGTAALQLGCGSGEAWVELGTQSNGIPIIALADGGRGISLAVRDESNRIRLRDDQSRLRLEIGVAPDGTPFVEFLNEDGVPIPGASPTPRP
jgi:hypothetical protein